jgi:hypothetical protein
MAAISAVLTLVAGDRFPVAALLYDVATVGLTLATLRLLDRLVRTGAERWLGEAAPGRRVTAGALHATTMIVLASALLLVVLQLHPHRLGF